MFAQFLSSHEYEKQKSLLPKNNMLNPLIVEKQHLTSQSWKVVAMRKWDLNILLLFPGTIIWSKGMMLRSWGAGSWREPMIELWRFLSLKMSRAGVSDPKFEGHGCWATKSLEAPSLANAWPCVFLSTGRRVPATVGKQTVDCEMYKASWCKWRRKFTWLWWVRSTKAATTMAMTAGVSWVLTRCHGLSSAFSC